MTKEELGWLHRLEARMEIEGPEAGERILKRLASFDRFLEGHHQMVTKARERCREFHVAARPDRDRLRPRREQNPLLGQATNGR